MPHIETTIDIVLRRTSRKWLGIVQIDGREMYRTLDYHETKEGALERANAWFKEMRNTMHGVVQPSESDLKK